MKDVKLRDLPGAIKMMQESFTTMAFALGQLRRIQMTTGLPPDACEILDAVDSFMERNGGDLDDD